MKKFGFGLMRLPLLDQADTKSIDIETVKKDGGCISRYWFFVFRHSILLP